MRFRVACELVFEDDEAAKRPALGFDFCAKNVDPKNLVRAMLAQSLRPEMEQR